MTKPLTGDLEKFDTALKSKLIINASREGLVQVLRLVMVKVGLRANNWPDKLETEILIQHINENFGGHRLDEIKLAFDMAIMRKLKCESNCYENFSCAYFTQVMNAYQDWAKEEYRFIEEKNYEDRVIDKLTLDLEYACYLQKKSINKLPSLFSDIIKMRQKINQ